MSFLFVALGGALGTMARYLISLIPMKADFPVLTLVTNLLGAILIGFVVGLFSRDKISKNASLFLKTGFCGGFTTFSTFSLESFELLETGRILAGGSYMLLSLVLCVLGVLLGRCLAYKLQTNI